MLPDVLPAARRRLGGARHWRLHPPAPPVAGALSQCASGGPGRGAATALAGVPNAAAATSTADTGCGHTTRICISKLPFDQVPPCMCCCWMHHQGSGHQCEVNLRQLLTRWMQVSDYRKYVNNAVFEVLVHGRFQQLQRFSCHQTGIDCGCVGALLCLARHRCYCAAASKRATAHAAPLGCMNLGPGPNLDER